MPFAGLLQCAACRSQLSCRYTSKAGVRYLYYVCALCLNRAAPKPKPLASTDLEASLLRELEPLLGAQPSFPEMRQAVECLSHCFLSRQLSVSLRDGSRFAYRVPLAAVRVARKPKPPYLQRVPALTRMMALAITCHRLIEDGTVSTYQELARMTGLSRGRLSQILLLASLAPDIQEHILFLSKIGTAPDRLFWKDVQHIVPVVGWREQNHLFRAVWVQASRRQ